MERQVKTRKQIEEKYTWNVTRLFKTSEEYETALAQVQKDVEVFVENFEGKIKDKDTVNKALDAAREIQTKLSYLGEYAFLQICVDQGSEEHIIRQGNLDLAFAKIGTTLTFLQSELEELDDKILEEAKKTSPENARYLTRLLHDKKHKLSPELNRALSEFSPVFQAPYANYNAFKFADMKFMPFESKGEKHELSFTLFENDYEYEVDTELRRDAHKAFYDTLTLYENGLANNYQTQVLIDKAYAKLKGFDSVINYLLDQQEVTRNMFDTQLDTIMEYLRAPMRKYVSLLKKAHRLDKLTYADLKLSLDPSSEKTISIEESRSYMEKGLAVMGEEYLEMVGRAFDERWIDFPQNLGKSTGGFCASPYQKGSYILLNWNYKMDEAFVLAHELGHAGHFYYAGKYQNAFDTEPSLFFIEAPSTINELFMGQYLETTATDKRLKRWVLSTIISRTYYHNMVTHFLEAIYQRDVYRYVDQGKPLSAAVLKQLTLKALRDFWGDIVEIPESAGLTWMRQPHYFSGLYSYTYSSGLTIATSVTKQIFEGTLEVERWKDVLKAGGTKSPLELAKMVNVDLSTEQPFLDTIAYIAAIVDEIEQLTNEIEEEESK